MIKSFLLVFLGGGLGSMCRFAISRILNSVNYPFGTFLVNIIGGIVIGFILGYSLKENQFSQNFILLSVTGFCGGFTTFSAFSYENAIFWKEGNYTMAIGYILFSIITGILSVFLGIWLNKI